MKNSNNKLPSNKKFGFFFTGIFLLLGFYLLILSLDTFAWISFGITASFLAISLVNSDFLLPLNKLWMRLGLLLGFIISPLVLGLLFFLIFTPIGLLTRLFGRDELNIKIKPHSSYWIERQKTDDSSEPLKNQF